MNVRYDLSGLHSMLQKALELELFTIPPYLTALYSIKEGHNEEAAQVIQGVVMEEMLHAVLVANVMNAVGGKPCLSEGGVDGENGWRVERCHYPSRTPYVETDLEVWLRRFSELAIKTFMDIEEPEEPKEWEGAIERGTYASVGHFYDAVLDRLIALCVDMGESNVFVGSGERQVGRDRYYYGAGGNIVEVHDLASAKDVIALVAQQGEGRREISALTGDHERFGQPKEVAHYFRFKQILHGRYYDRDDPVHSPPTGPELKVDWNAVHPMEDNPDAGSSSPAGVVELYRAFDRTYGQLLLSLHLGFNGKQEALGEAVTAMHRLRHQCTALMKVEKAAGLTHGPPFWYIKCQPG